MNWLRIQYYDEDGENGGGLNLAIDHICSIQAIKNCATKKYETWIEMTNGSRFHSVHSISEIFDMMGNEHEIKSQETR